MSLLLRTAKRIQSEFYARTETGQEKAKSLIADVALEVLSEKTATMLQKLAAGRKQDPFVTAEMVAITSNVTGFGEGAFYNKLQEGVKPIIAKVRKAGFEAQPEFVKGFTETEFGGPAYIALHFKPLNLQKTFG